MINLKSRFGFAALACGLIGAPASGASPGMRILNFQADHGFAHESKSAALSMVESLGKKNGWQVVPTVDAASLTQLDLTEFDVIVFNNNCGNEGPVMTPEQQRALQAYIRTGGGFLGIHCAGALWKEGGEFQAWYEGLIGTKLIDHPAVQEAVLHVEDRSHIATRHLPEEWIVTDEWHRFGSNPRDKVHVLISVDENSYEGAEKMGGDHPFTWCHEYEGGRSFFTSLGHTKEIYADENFRKLIEGAILWAGQNTPATPVSAVPVTVGLLLDLDADKGVETEDGSKVKAWHNQVAESAVDVFVKRDEGRKEAGSGRPELLRNVARIGGHNTLVFREQELVNMQEDAFDHLITGSGYTWFVVMNPYVQNGKLKDVNVFLGNLANGSKFEGFWAGLEDDNVLWSGSRNGITIGRFDVNNPKLNGPKLEPNQYHVVAGRQGAGTGTVSLDLFVDSATPSATVSFPVNTAANPSRLAIGTERDAVGHPGLESFDGELARVLIYERPLTEGELSEMIDSLKAAYLIRK